MKATTGRMEGRAVADGPAERPRAAPPPRWGAFLRVFVSLALVALVCTKIGSARTRAMLLGALPLSAALTIVSLLLERFYAAYRWWILLRVHDPGMPFGLVLRVVFVSLLYGMFLPGGGVEVVRVLALSRSGNRLGVSFGSVAMDRVLGLLTLLLIALAGCAWAGIRVPGSMAPWVWAGLAVCAAATAMLCVKRARRLAWRFVPAGLSRRLQPRFDALGAYLKQLGGRPALLSWAFLLAVGIQVVRVVTVWFAALALGIHAPIAAYFAFVPLIVIAQLLPIAVGGLGVREAAFVFFFGTVGVSAEAAFALSLLVYVTTIVSSLPGAWMRVARAGGAA